MTVPTPASSRFPMTVRVDPRAELDAIAKYAGTFDYVAASFDSGCSSCAVLLHACMFDKGASCCDECQHDVIREVPLDAALRVLLERGHGVDCLPPIASGPGVCRCELADLATHLEQLAGEVRAIRVVGVQVVVEGPGGPGA